MTNAIEVLKQQFNALRDWDESLLQGYSETELIRMEKKLGFEWPKFFRDYLAWGGKYTPFFRGYRFPEENDQLQIYVRGCFERLRSIYATETNQLQRIPKEGFVLDGYLGGYYLILPITGNENPFLLEWHEGENPAITKTEKKLIDFLEEPFKRFQQEYVWQQQKNKNLSDAKWELLGLTIQLQRAEALNEKSKERLEYVFGVLNSDWDRNPKTTAYQLQKSVKRIRSWNPELDDSIDELLAEKKSILDGLEA